MAYRGDEDSRAYARKLKDPNQVDRNDLFANELLAEALVLSPQFIRSLIRVNCEADDAAKESGKLSQENWEERRGRWASVDIHARRARAEKHREDFDLADYESERLRLFDALARAFIL